VIGLQKQKEKEMKQQHAKLVARLEEIRKRRGFELSPEIMISQHFPVIMQICL
jgi:hypothetical protein